MENGRDKLPFEAEVTSLIYYESSIIFPTGFDKMNEEGDRQQELYLCALKLTPEVDIGNVIR